MSSNSHKYNRYRAISKIKSKKIRSGNGNPTHNSGRMFRVGSALVAHGKDLQFCYINRKRYDLSVARFVGVRGD